MILEEIEKLCAYWNREGEKTIPIYQVIEVGSVIIPKLLAVAKAAKYLTDRQDNYYLHCEIQDPLMINLRSKIRKLEGEQEHVDDIDDLNIIL